MLSLVQDCIRILSCLHCCSHGPLTITPIWTLPRTIFTCAHIFVCVCVLNCCSYGPFTSSPIRAAPRTVYISMHACMHTCVCVCACVCVCIYIYIYIYIYICVCACINISTRCACMHVCAQSYMLCIDTYIHNYINKYTHINVLVPDKVFRNSMIVYPNLRTYIQTCLHTYTHTYK